MKEGEQEYFKVSMLDKSLNQEQIILKNVEGVFAAKLTLSTVSSDEGNVSHILEFTGDKSFTMIQKPVNNNNELELTEIDGELVEGFGLLGYYNGNCLTIISSQMETSVYSQDLSVIEMLQVVDSMQVTVMK